MKRNNDENKDDDNNDNKINNITAHYYEGITITNIYVIKYASVVPHVLNIYYCISGVYVSAFF